MSASGEVRIFAACSPGEIRIAVQGPSGLLDYALDRPASPDGVGDLHLGRVGAVLPALGGAFIRLGAEDGFLPDHEGAAGLTEGALVAVRVTRSAQGGKGVRLSARLEDAERAHVAEHGDSGGLVARGPDALHRFADAWPQAPILCDDVAVTARLHGDFAGRLRSVGRAFDDQLEAETASLAEPELALPGGLRASIHPTPALVAIDMDGAGTAAERRAKQTVQFAANRAAIPALLHQLRLRNLSGAILLDLAGLAARKRRALAPDIEAALARDPLAPRLLGFTALGLAEILRPRIHPPLHEWLQTPLGAGLAALRNALGAAAGRARAAPVRIRGGIAVITALQVDREALADFSRRTAAPISLTLDPSLPELYWTIEDH